MRIFYVISDFENGGVEALLLKYIAALPDGTDCHIVAQGETSLSCKARFQDASVTVHFVPGRKHPLAHRRALTALFLTYRPDVVHVHTGERAAAALAAAGRAGVPCRIQHSHTAARCERNPFLALLYRIDLIRSRRAATRLVACGDAAARYAFGKRMTENNRVTVLKNGINTAAYAFSGEARTAARAALGLDADSTAILMVARFERQKNHRAALRIFAAYLAAHPRAVLLLVGGGRELSKIKRLAGKLPKGAVRFLGERGDVAALLSAADRFILPSRFEGLPLTLLEALAAGLLPVVSDRVSREVTAAGDIQYLPVRDTAAWVRALENAVPTERVGADKRLATAGFSEQVMLAGLLTLYGLA